MKALDELEYLPAMVAAFVADRGGRRGHDDHVESRKTMMYCPP